MSSFLRESKFKNIQATTVKKEFWYEQLKISQNDNTSSNMVTGNTEFIAYIESSNNSTAVGVIPISQVGKNHVPIVAKVGLIFMF